MHLVQVGLINPFLKGKLGYFVENELLIKIIFD